MPAPLQTYLLCLAGMLVGLVWDAAQLPLEALLTLCSSADSLLSRGWLHWRLLPAAHGLMLAAALIALLPRLRGERGGRARRACAEAGCLAAMLIGMLLALPLVPPLAAWLGSAAAAMTLAMAGGMALGLVASRSLYQLAGRRQ